MPCVSRVDWWRICSWWLMAVVSCRRSRSRLGALRGGHMLKVFFGFGGQGSNGLAQFEELVLCVAHQLHENPTLSATAAAKGTHDLCERLLEPLGWAVELGPAAVTLLDDVGDER